MQNRFNYSDAEHNDTSITVHLQSSSYLVLFLKQIFFGAKWQIEIKMVYSVMYCCVFFLWHGKYRLCQVILLSFASFCKSHLAFFFLNLGGLNAKDHCHNYQKYFKALNFWFSDYWSVPFLDLHQIP